MLKVVFEDEALLVIDKPPNLVVTATQTQQEPTLEDLLKNNYHIQADRSGIVHRLDKDTSGLMLVAKNNLVLQALQIQFKERTVDKSYLALVHGRVEQAGKIETLIGRNPGDREKFVVFADEEDDSGILRQAITEYQPISQYQFLTSEYQNLLVNFNKIQQRKLNKANYNVFSLLRCHPLTGRTHQIRVHLKYIGHSIVGDEKYGGRKTARLDKRWCPRQFLHAAELSFDHPQTGERLEFESKLPKDLQDILDKLEECQS
ncbi:RluA family pseudouridine synthase [Patescibacteria group bacterium]|nr:RluA family pseudouridine synthase [Patescibacteria group bacterium]